jgi:hypothetical protein
MDVKGAAPVGIVQVFSGIFLQVCRHQIAQDPDQRQHREVSVELRVVGLLRQQELELADGRRNIAEPTQHEGEAVACFM